MALPISQGWARAAKLHCYKLAVTSFFEGSARRELLSRTAVAAKRLRPGVPLCALLAGTKAPAIFCIIMV
jgi:hypothetical protein